MRKAIVLMFVIACAPHVSTTPDRRDSDCQTWSRRATAEEARAKQLDGGKGTYTAQSNAEMYRDGIRKYCTTTASR